MFYLINYLKHLFSATNQHGVHSPFVYAYVTKGLYSTYKSKVSKTEQVLFKSIRYFSSERLHLNTASKELKDLIKQELSQSTSENPPFDLIYIDQPSADLIVSQKNNIHNDSMILVNDIYKNESNAKVWEALKQDALVRVSIDMFFCGALFFRKEQVKEHFKIRL